MTKAVHRKRGAASLEEEAYVRKNMEHMSDEDMATVLNRTLPFIAKLRAQTPVRQKKIESNDAVAKLHKNHFWLGVKNSLLPSEVAFFEQQWVKLMNQFATSEILATDEMMMKDLIILELGGLRALSQKKKALILLQELEKQVERERVNDSNEQDVALLASWHSQINSLRAALPALTKEYLDFQQRKDQKYKDLKATRDLRFKHIEESKRNIFELLKDLDTLKRRKQEGRWMELMRRSSNKIEKGWQDTMEYEDGTYDSPFLSPEGILAENEITINREVYDKLVDYASKSNDEELLQFLRDKEIAYVDTEEVDSGGD